MNPDTARIEHLVNPSVMPQAVTRRVAMLIERHAGTVVVTMIQNVYNYEKDNAFQQGHILVVCFFPLTNTWFCLHLGSHNFKLFYFLSNPAFFRECRTNM